MSTQENVQTVKNFFAAMGRGDKPGLLALSAEDIEWIIPGEDWPLAGTHRGHQGLVDLPQKASESSTPHGCQIPTSCASTALGNRPAAKNASAIFCCSPNSSLLTGCT